MYGTRVLGGTTAAGALAATGVSTLGWMVVAITLVVVGFGLLRLSMIRRAAAADRGD